MPRRVGLPGAAELFRSTAPAEDGPAETGSAAPEQALASGRVKHDEKITVYVSSAELLALEHARLRLRAEHGLAVDRGRIVRTAIGLIMADFEAEGDESGLVRALAEQ
ncbi:MAG: hypothetical protein LCH76_03655 [Actinobacteria bacterium]|nr:hypothetical protein [Actinomycetota bacterium]